MAVENKVSIYIGPPMGAVLTAVPGHESRSGRLNTVCERYLVMVADALARADLLRAEWYAIFDANNGIAPAAGGGVEISAVMLWANIEDSTELGEKWGIDKNHLVQKLRALPKSSLIAIREACDRFWARVDLPRDEAFQQAQNPTRD